MPSRNVLKIYSKGACYHIYNRGVEKRKIFLDDQDYKVFLGYLKEYLSPPPDPKTRIKNKNPTPQGETLQGVTRLPKNYSEDVALMAYCLMPNHFHLMIKQNSERAIENFMRSLLTRYSGYFNKRNDRVGSLFQGPYKATLIDNDVYLLHLSRYIHTNPGEFTNNLLDTYSSYSEYLNLRKTPWIKPELVLSFFNQASKDFIRGYNTYKRFVEDSDSKINSAIILGNLCIDNI